MCICFSTAVHHKDIIWQLRLQSQPCENANSCFTPLSCRPKHKQKYPKRKKKESVCIEMWLCCNRGCVRGRARVYLCIHSAYTAQGPTLAACRADAGRVGVTSTHMLLLRCSKPQWGGGGGGRRGRSCEKRSKKKEKKKLLQCLVRPAHWHKVCLCLPPRVPDKGILVCRGLWPSLFDTSAPFVKQVSHRQCWPWESLGIRQRVPLQRRKGVLFGEDF